MARAPAPRPASATAEDLRAALRAHDAADARTRRKLARSLGHAALTRAARPDLDPGEIQTILAALRAAARAHSHPQKLLAAQARLLARRRELTGQAEPAARAEVRGRIDVETGALALFDPERGLPDAFFDAGGRAFDAEMAAGAFFCVALPGDGPVRVVLRSLEAGPPEPAAAELPRVRGATPPGRLALPSGRLVLHGGGATALDLDTGAEALHAQAFLLGTGRGQSVLVVVAPGDPGEVEPPAGAPSLELY